MDRHNIRVSRKRKKQKKLLIILLPLVLLILCGFGYSFYLANKVTDATEESHKELKRGIKSEKRINPVDPKKDNISVLLAGVDDRNPDERGRTDALILLTFNKQQQTIKMVSIPRDSRVEIPGHGVDKINAAHSIGDIDLTVETIESLFDIPVDYYARFNFTAFMDVVDALGGVEVDVFKTFSEQDSQDNHNAITLEEGRQLLNGEEALAFVRMRKHDPRGDFGRNDRQQQVIKAIIEKSTSITSFTKYDDVIESIGDNLTTNLTLGNLVALHNYSDSLSSIESLKLEGYDNWINRGYYFSLYDESVQAITNELKEHLGIQQ